MLTQRSIAQAFLTLQAVLSALLAVMLTTTHNPYALTAAVSAVVSVIGLVLTRRSANVAMDRLKAQTQEAEAAREQAETAAREAIAERDRASKLEATLLHTQAAEALPATSGVVAVARPTHRVLVVEDEPQVRAIAARALTNAGFEVQQAANGALGLTLLKAQRIPFDVLVTDVVMPELSGPDLVRAARKFDPKLGIVFMSGFPEAMHDTHACDFAGAAFLAKPFAPKALAEAVRDCIERRAAELRELG